MFDSPQAKQDLISPVAEKLKTKHLRKLENNAILIINLFVNLELKFL